MNLLTKILFISFLMLSVFNLTAERLSAEEGDIKTVKIDTTKVEGKLKAGVALGYPWGITAGYRFSNIFELNGTLGSDYNDFTMGVNGLFTVVNLDISNEKFPISVGPALYSHFGHRDGNDKDGRDDEYTRIDLLGVVRVEYSFDEIPLNLFVEAGLGLEVVKFAHTAGSFAIGVRYIF
ncbi:MAG: hypothetical protein CVV49_11380 [Spirochaetae bacterium HGW-Spirochaetae-5]|nr:MAG: hypothetical protein CVV49_11380 [Spirochaetae bacterium HGW-Spirochaetae-5]